MHILRIGIGPPQEGLIAFWIVVSDKTDQIIGIEKAASI
jgi:hypothetical protein